MQKIFSIAFIVLSAVIVACSNGKTPDQTAEDIIPVKVLELQQDSLRQEIHSSGQFSTDDETNLSFKNGGVVNRIYVKEGDAVKKGQLIATLHLDEVNAMSQQASLGLQKAQRDYERASNLYKDSVATLEQMQNAKTALDVARQQYNTAGFNQAYSEIRAMKSGYVLRKFVNEGQIVGPGTPVVQLNGAAAGDWVLKTGVSDQQWASVKLGDKATITTDALPGKSFEAVVSKKSEGIDPLSGTFQLQLQLKDVPAGTVASGLFGKATIYPARMGNAWSVPYDALLDGDASSGYVFITNDNVIAKKVKVKVWKVENRQVLISEGLEGAKAVIISGSAYLNDSSKIKVETSNK